MSIWYGYIGLAVGFILLIVMLLWIVISSKGNLFLKALLIPVTTWYGAVIFFSAQNLMGWPVGKYVPEDSYVLAFRIREPDPITGHPGAIFLWASSPADSNPGEGGDGVTPAPGLNPQRFFDYQDKSEPRAYRLPYDREMHKMLLEAGQTQKNQPGSLIQIRKKEDKPDGQNSGNEQSLLMDLNIVNPLEMLPEKD